MSGPVVRNHNSLKMTDEYNAARRTVYRSLSLVYRPVLPAQLHRHLQHRHRRSCSNKRNESRSRQARGDLSPEPTETENTHKNEDTELARRDSLRDLRECSEEFTEHLLDERVPVHKDAPASSSRESASEPLRKVVSGEHSHFPNDRHCDICMKT